MDLASIRPHLHYWGLRGSWVAAVALWGVALVPWFGNPEPAAPDAPRSLLRSDEPAAAAAPSPAREENAAVELPEPVFVPQRQRAAAPEAAVAMPAERGRGDSQVCGLNDAAQGGTDAPSAAQRAAYVARQTGIGLQQAFEDMRARSEPQAQAAAWWLRVLLARDGAADAPPAPAPCAPGTDCAGATPSATALPPVTAAVDALAQLALASNDAWQLQIATRACDTPTAACSGLAGRRWSTLEPDNAAAWLEQSTRDAGSVDEALFRASRATRFDSRRGQLAGWVLQAMPERVPAMQRHAAWQRADELERAADARVMAAAARHCSDSARRDANRGQVCDALARWLTPDAARAPLTEPPLAASTRSLDCASLERQWREARDAAQRGARVAVQGTALVPRP